MTKEYAFNYTDEKGADVISTGRSSTKNGYYWYISNANGVKYPLRAPLHYVVSTHPPESGTVKVATAIQAKKPIRMTRNVDINLFLLDNDLGI